jgi:hypothetical protein
METQPSLFGQTAGQVFAKPSRKEEAHRKADLAYEKTEPAWKRSIYDLALNEFLPFHETFIFEEFTIFYEAQARKRRLPVTVKHQSWAGLRTRLVRERLMARIEGDFRQRTNGVYSPAYRSLIYGR